ncbi:hypothetical protein MMPV_004290 [Pyropia vietnamensis]
MVPAAFVGVPAIATAASRRAATAGRQPQPPHFVTTPPASATCWRPWLVASAAPPPLVSSAATAGEAATSPPGKAPSPTQRAIIFDCDGVLLESEELHRVAYNKTWAAAGLGFEWSVPYYDELQNAAGGGRAKMIYYFDEAGWPARVTDGDAAGLEDRKAALLDELVAAKTRVYTELIDTGAAAVRPGVLRLIDEAHSRGVVTAICSAANKEAVARTLPALLGPERLARFDLVLAGDDVAAKKPDPLIYNTATERLGLPAEACVVIEDSAIGVAAAVAAGLRVVVTTTPSTASQAFEGADRVLPGLGEVGVDAPEDIVDVDSLFP